MKKQLIKRKSLTLLASISLTILAGFTTAVQAETEISQSVTAVKDVQPEFPESALRRETSGYVVVRFDVSSSGKARNIEVVDAQPARLFDANAVRALRRSEFIITSGDETVTGVERTYRFSHKPEQALSMN